MRNIRGGWKLSDETKRKLSLSKLGNKNPMFGRTGEKCPRWKGGITSINKIIRGSLEYRIWRNSVFERDKYTCIWCGNKSEKGKRVFLHADHIKPFAYYPELRFAIDNRRTLCRECHKTTDTYKKRIYHILQG